MSKYSIDSTTLTAIGDAIRTKEGTSAAIPVSDFATRITNIPSGGGGVFFPPFPLNVSRGGKIPSGYTGASYTSDMVYNISPDALTAGKKLRIQYKLTIPTSGSNRSYNFTIYRRSGYANYYSGTLVATVFTGYKPSSTVTSTYDYTIQADDLTYGLILRFSIYDSSAMTSAATNLLTIESLEVID